MINQIELKTWKNKSLIILTILNLFNKTINNIRKIFQKFKKIIENLKIKIKL